MPGIYLGSDAMSAPDSVSSLTLNMKYLLVIISGVCIDLMVSLAMIKLLDSSLIKAAVIGYLFGLCFVYFLHERFTFSTFNNNLAAKRIFRYLLVSGCVLGLRLLIIKCLAPLPLFSECIILVILIANFMSFSINYIAAVYLIFVKKSP